MKTKTLKEIENYMSYRFNKNSIDRDNLEYCKFIIKMRGNIIILY